jgi:hypothetical protein
MSLLLEINGFLWFMYNVTLLFQGEFDSGPGHDTQKFLFPNLAVNGIVAWMV